MMKRTPLLLPVLLSLLALTGCGWVFGAAAVGGGVYSTKREPGPPADTAAQIPAHEDWCYSTMGDQVECFAQPQDTPPTRLVNVDPQSRYPLTNKAYHQTLMESQAAEAQRDAMRNMPPGTTVTTTVETVETKPLSLTSKKKVVVTKKTVTVKKPPVKKKIVKHKKKVVHKKLAPKPTVPPAAAAPQPDPVMPEDLPQPAMPN